ncbi:DNA methyltransferase [Rhodopseudomonas sp. RCAM05734]|uniref:DNA methyltransferase n=1 Tax=Rhodopseudomonas sp. RCAM05734 TaxID=3457549 RepID=UPI0040446A0B
MSKSDYQNSLHFGDNLEVLRKMPPASVDLIYLDPPFNSNANYNVLYGTKRGGASQAQSHAFQDTWEWGKDAQRALNETAARHLEAGALLEAFQKVFAGSDMMAYLAMMAVRLIEMRRVLKNTGSVYLHCDPTASHYLKVLLDAIFGPVRFVNEIVWKRYGAHNDSSTYGRIHDVLLFYSRSEEMVFNKQHEPYSAEYIEERFRFSDPDGRRWAEQNLASPNPRPNLTYKFKAKNGITYDPPSNGWKYTPDRMSALDASGGLHYPARPGGRLRMKNYLDERLGVPVQDVWTDITLIGGTSPERLKYPTQKPLTLLERIISASSNEGDVVLDPFCGCGTAIEAAQKLGRRWIGIDVTYLAIHVIESRLVKSFGENIKDEYKLFGQPQDANDANALAARDWLEFQKWAVMKLGGLPKDRPGADGGIDGIIRYHRVGIEQPNRAVVSVKGGLNVGVDDVHKLKSVIKREGAEVGVLVCLNPPGAAMRKEAASEDEVGPPSRRVQRIQIVTIEDLFKKHPVDLPGMLDPPEVVSPSPAFQPKRGRKKMEGQTEMLLSVEGDNKAPKRKANRPIRVVEMEVTRAGPHRKVK